MSYLIIVESPGKIKKIESFLGDDYKVKASFGIIMDLDKKTMSIDFDNNFEPIYVLLPEKINNWNEVKKLASKAKLIYLAADMDREGEGIAASYVDQLKLPENKYKRIVFNEITKKAILNAIKNPVGLNYDLVGAQKARRVLDRLIGYMISPILQKMLKGKMSAGRVQSVVLKLIVEKENEIKDFLEKNSESSFYRIIAMFNDIGKATLHKVDDNEMAKFPDDKIVIKLLKKCVKSQFKIDSIETKRSFRNPPPPFITSSLQLEANRKFGFNPKMTMDIAQKLYEGGHITYMRTDSVEISKDAHKAIKEYILEEFGDKYYHHRTFENKSKNAQEAHECIRPTHVETPTLDIDELQNKLYNLIWRRTIASQMEAAEIEIMTIKILASQIEDYYFQAQSQKIIFKGYLKVYQDTDEESTKINPDLSEGQIVTCSEIRSDQEFLKPPTRYTEASLVKKLEDLGIGRPSTFTSMVGVNLKKDWICH